MRISRDRRFVWPDRYYIWSYFPNNIRKSIYQRVESRLYAKNYCRIPYFSRLHARHVATFYHGRKANKYIHIISGKRLIKQGITTFPRYKYEEVFFLRNQVRHLRQWAYPIEFRSDKHRRRRYITCMNEAFNKGGKNLFNDTYKLYNIGNQYRRFSTKWLNRKYRNVKRRLYNQLVEEDLMAKGLLEKNRHIAEFDE